MAGYRSLPSPWCAQNYKLLLVLRSGSLRAASTSSRPEVVRIKDATFYRHHKSVTQNNPPLFPNLSLSLYKEKPEYWAVISPSSAARTAMLDCLRGLLFCEPPLSRTFPALSEQDSSSVNYRDPLKAIQYVGFNSSGGTFGGNPSKGAYISARYESRREDTDFSLLNYLTGNMSLNPSVEEKEYFKSLENDPELERIGAWLNLKKFLKMPVSVLSNGQTRRARIAKALLNKPEVLLLDQPFLGLDPMTRRSISPLLLQIHKSGGPLVVIGLEDDEIVPRWITHLLYVDTDCSVKAQGTTSDALKTLSSLKGNQRELIIERPEDKTIGKSSSNAYEQEDSGLESQEKYAAQKKDQKASRAPRTANANLRWHSVEDVSSESFLGRRKSGESLLEMSGVKVSYEDRAVLGHWTQKVDGEEREGLWWDVRRGDRWGVFGPNGSGKTTLLSIICSDHPQAYSLPIKFFGRPRLPTKELPGISIFDIQNRIGNSSPEVHSFFPRSLSVRQTIENAWADAFLAKPRLTHEIDQTVDAALRWFRYDLDPSFKGADPLDSLCDTYYMQGVANSKLSSTMSATLKAYMDEDLDWADRTTFRDLSLSGQKVALFLRAFIKKPDIVILDEAFSGMEEHSRIKSMLFLAYGESRWLAPPLKKQKARSFSERTKKPPLIEAQKMTRITGLEPRQALLCVSHRPDEVPPIVNEWMCLPESGNGSVRFGNTPSNKKGDWMKPDWWEEIWGGV